jgi:hypothetical protein
VLADRDFSLVPISAWDASTERDIHRKKPFLPIHRRVPSGFAAYPLYKYILSPQEKTGNSGGDDCTSCLSFLPPPKRGGSPEGIF